jgi:glycosyltransferase involved in cell wall biosynthesis
VKFLCLEGTLLHEKVAAHPSIEGVPLSFSPRNFCDFKLRNELWKLLDQGVNLIHTHQTTLLGSIVPWLWKYPSVGLIASRHMMNSHSKKDFFHRALYSRVDALVVVSDAIRTNILETHAIQERKVKVIRLGLDFDKFDPARVSPQQQRQIWGIDPNAHVIGLVGRIDPAKGQATFIRAAAGLVKSWKGALPLKFVMIGEETRGADNNHLQELQEMVRQFRLEDSVLFTGFHDDIPQAMAALDMVVMPSRQEAFGLVAIEAMAMECPVLISRGGSAQEIVGNEEYGLLVRPDDAFDVQRQLRFFLENSEARRATGRRARQHVRAWYDCKKRLVNTIHLYERVLRRRKVKNWDRLSSESQA